MQPWISAVVSGAALLTIEVLLIVTRLGRADDARAAAKRAANIQPRLAPAEAEGTSGTTAAAPPPDTADVPADASPAAAAADDDNDEVELTAGSSSSSSSGGGSALRRRRPQRAPYEPSS